MTGRAKLSEAQQREVADLRESGWTYARLAERFDVSVSTIDYWCLKLGADPPAHMRQTIPDRRVPRTYKRNGRTVRHFSEQEDRRIEEMTAAGITPAAIGRVLGRGGHVITRRLQALARAAERRDTDREASPCVDTANA